MLQYFFAQPNFVKMSQSSSRFTVLNALEKSTNARGSAESSIHSVQAASDHIPHTASYKLPGHSSLFPSPATHRRQTSTGYKIRVLYTVVRGGDLSKGKCLKFHRGVCSPQKHYLHHSVGYLGGKGAPRQSVSQYGSRLSEDHLMCASNTCFFS